MLACSAAGESFLLFADRSVGNYLLDWCEAAGRDAGPETAMTASIINGKAPAQRLRELVGVEVARLQSEHELQTGLALVLVGEDPASQVYVRNKGK